MKLENVVTVIASREFTLDGEHKVQILIGKPETMPASNDRYCPNQIIGIGLAKVECMAGVDPVQVLVSALTMVDAELYCSEEHEASPKLGMWSYERRPRLFGARKYPGCFAEAQSCRDVKHILCR